MKNLNRLMILSVFCLLMAACSKSETALDAGKIDQNPAAGREMPFLTENEMPTADIRETHKDAEFILTLTNRLGEKKEIEIFGNSGYEPSLEEKIYTLPCGRKMLLIVIRQEIKTAAAFGSFFYNTLIDPKTGEWVTAFHGSEIGDKDTGEIISDDQKAILAKLKAGITQHCPRILDPNNDKAVEQLLQ